MVRPLEGGSNPSVPVLDERWELLVLTKKDAMVQPLTWTLVYPLTNQGDLEQDLNLIYQKSCSFIQVVEA